MRGPALTLKARDVVDAARTIGRSQGYLRTRQALDRFLILSSHHENVGELLRQSLGEFSRLLPNDGIGVMFDGTWTAQGSVPPEEALPELLRFVGPVCAGRIWATHALSQKLPTSADYSERVSGMLAIPLSQTGSDCLLFFRKEWVHTLNWAGNPDKTYDTGPHGDRLTPRKSFAIWKETVEQRSRQREPETRRPSPDRQRLARTHTQARCFGARLAAATIFRTPRPYPLS